LNGLSINRKGAGGKKENNEIGGGTPRDEINGNDQEEERKKVISEVATFPKGFGQEGLNSIA